MSNTEPVKAPSQKAMATVKHKNNIDENKLRKFLEQLEKEKALAILLIDHERLDLMDFLKSLKDCASRHLPEAKHALEGDMGQKKPPPPTPSQESNAEEEAQKKVEKYRPWEEDFDQGVFKTGDRDQSSKAKVHLDIYSKRNALANLSWVKDYFEEEGLGLSKSRSESVADDASITFEDKRRISCVSSTGRDLLATTPGGLSSRNRSRLLSEFSQVESRYSNESPDGVRPKSYASLKRRGSLPSAQGVKASFVTTTGKTGGRGQRRGRDFMKDLLVRNAHDRYQDKRRIPLKDRMSDFFSKVGEMSKEEKKMDPLEIKRRWILLLQGVKAALDESSDDEDDKEEEDT